MPKDGSTMTEQPLLADLLSLTAEALPEVEALLDSARATLKERVTVGGKVSSAALEQDHGATIRR